MMGLELFFALVMLAALIAYALLGCADFGGGIWDLLSIGPRASGIRRARSGMGRHGGRTAAVGDLRTPQDR